jgi:hypothetical protein
MAPIQVLTGRPFVRRVLPILLAQIERRVCKDGVHYRVSDGGEDLHAITIEEGSQGRDVVRMD